MSEWEPATDAEVAMRDALRTDDQESYFRILAGVDLLLPVSADVLAGLAPLGWGTWSTGGRTHVLAFTSNASLRACLADYTGSARRVPYSELANTWPNLEWWLAVNPGLPIEGYLPAWFVAQLARGDLRLPTRGPGREAHTTSKIQEIGAAALAASRAGENAAGGPTYDPAPAPAPVPVAPAVAPIPPVGTIGGAQPPPPAQPPVGPGGLPVRTPSGTAPSGLPVRSPAGTPPAASPAYQTPPVPPGYQPSAPADHRSPAAYPAPPAPAAYPVPPVPGAVPQSPAGPRSVPPGLAPASAVPASGVPASGRGGTGAGMATPGWERPGMPFSPAEDPRGPLQDLNAPLPVRTPMANTPPVPEHVAPYDPAEAQINPSWAENTGTRPSGSALPASAPPNSGPPAGAPLSAPSSGAPLGGPALPRRQPGQSAGGGSMSSMAGFVPSAKNVSNAGRPASAPPASTPPPLRPAPPAGGPAPAAGFGPSAPTGPVPGSPAPGPGTGSAGAVPDSGASARGFGPDSSGSGGSGFGPGPSGSPVPGSPAPGFGPGSGASGYGQGASGFGPASAGSVSSPPGSGAGPVSSVSGAGPAGSRPGFGPAASGSGFGPDASGYGPGMPGAGRDSATPGFGPAGSAESAQPISPSAPGAFGARPVSPSAPEPASPALGGPGGLPRRQVTPPSERPASMAAAAQALGASRTPVTEPPVPGPWDRAAPPPAADRFGPSGPAPSITPAPSVPGEHPAATTKTNLMPPVIPGSPGIDRAYSPPAPAGFDRMGQGSAVPAGGYPATVSGPPAPSVPGPVAYGLPPQGSPASAYATQAFATQVLPVSTVGYTPPGATNMGVTGSATGARGPAAAEFVPANDVERELQDAADTGNNDVFLSTLLLAKVLVPVASHSRPGSAPGESGFAFLPEEVEGERYLIVFTSKDRLSEHFGEPTRTVGVRFYELIRNWPDPAWSFAVNPGTPVGAKYPGAQIIALANWATEAGLGSEPVEGPVSEALADPVPAPEPASDEAQQATVMQKTISAEQVDYYLDRGYDRVAGFVHRASEVEHLRTPGELFSALGLYYDASPFQPGAEEAFVLRWPAYRPSLYRIPYGGQNEQALRAMDGWVIERPPFRGNGFAPGEGRDVIAEFKVDSVRLPHGAQLWSIDADGNERMMAIFDADGPLWRRVGEQ
ncbi:SseB family protein [Actinoplanes sp. NPDC049802]|uniref:SseB family protein n=1 Tax=Actinoplanes sp. NPDC049802 TaxID=3154742 RepID=UPI0033E0F987